MNIYKEYIKLKFERDNKIREFIDEYDKNIYYPHVKELRKICEERGHGTGIQDFDDKLEISWYICEKCGARFNEQKYEY